MAIKKHTSSLSTKKEGTIASIETSPLKKRLIELGFLAGRHVRIIRPAFWSRAVIVELNGQAYALRTKETDLIIIAAE